MQFLEEQASACWHRLHQSLESARVMRAPIAFFLLVKLLSSLRIYRTTAVCTLAFAWNRTQLLVSKLTRQIVCTDHWFLPTT